jgi:hypothetical protein
MFRLSKLTLLLVVMLVVGCSSVKVSQDFDPSKNIAAMKTFAWKAKTQPPTGDIRVDNPLLDARIRDAVERSLTDRGYQKQTETTPDFYIVYKYVIQRKLDSDGPQTGIGFGIGSFGSAGGIGISTGTSVSEHDEGLLVIDFLGPDNGELLWRGNGTRRVYQHSDPARTTQRINEMVDKIMTQITPRTQ